MAGWRKATQDSKVGERKTPDSNCWPKELDNDPQRGAENKVLTPAPAGRRQPCPARLGVGERSVGAGASPEEHRLQRPKQDKELVERLHELAQRHPAPPSPRKLKAEHWAVNRKRVQRLWRAEGLKVPTKTQNLEGTGERLPPAARTYAHHVWALDFLMDTTLGRGSTVVDEYSRACLSINVERSLTGSDDG